MRPAGFLGFAPRALFLLPLLRSGCLSALITEDAPDVGWTDRFRVEMISLEEQARVRGAAPPGPGRTRVDNLAPLLPDLIRGRWHGRHFRLAAFDSLRPNWRRALDGLGAHVQVPELPDHPVLTDKTAMRDWFQQLGIPTPRSTVIGGEIEYRVLRERFGVPFVVQTPASSSGLGTYLVTDEPSARAIPPGPRWLVSAYAGDITLNFHGFVTNNGEAHVLRPSLQICAVDGIGARFGQYAGCDFQAPRYFPAAVLSQCREAVARIGRGLSALGYRGVFGADFAVQGDAATALEINCRTQGSTWLLGEIESGEGSPSTLLQHVLTRHGQDVRMTSGGEPAEGTQIVIRHTGSPAHLHTVPTGGRYRLEEHGLRRLGDGPGLLECGPQDCLLMDVPRTGTVIHPGRFLARLVTRHPLTDASATALTPYGRRLVDATRRLYGFS